MDIKNELEELFARMVAEREGRGSPENTTVDGDWSLARDNLCEVLLGASVCPPWLAAQDINLVCELEDLIAPIADAPRAESTLDTYARNFRSMYRQGQTPEEAANQEKTFDFYRAVYKWGQARIASKLYSLAKRSLLDDDERTWRRVIKEFEDIKNTLEEYCDDDDTDKKESLFVPPQERHRKHHESKRKNAHNLPRGWREEVCFSASKKSKNRLAVFLMALCGPRPQELVDGIKVVLQKRVLYFFIEGVKLQDGTHGQELRGIAMPVQGAIAKELAKTVRENGNEMTISATTVSGLNKLLVRLGRKLYGQDMKLSAGDFRHAFASDAKAAKIDGEWLSLALGHASSRTKKVYGQAQQSRSKKAPFIAVIGSQDVRHVLPKTETPSFLAQKHDDVEHRERV